MGTIYLFINQFVMHMWHLSPSENGIGGKQRLTVIFLRRTEEGGGAEEDSPDRMRTADDLDLPRV